jgi:hypothetical protein
MLAVGVAGASNATSTDSDRILSSCELCEQVC